MTKRETTPGHFARTGKHDISHALVNTKIVFVQYCEYF